MVTPMELREALELGTYILATCGAICSSGLFLRRSYHKAVSEQYDLIARTWSNQNLVFGEDPSRSVTVRLKHHEKDVIGELNSNALGSVVELLVIPGWPWCKVEIFRINRASVTHIGFAKIRIAGNKNRLQWRVIKSTLSGIPSTALLWPRSEE